MTIDIIEFHTNKRGTRMPSRSLRFIAAATILMAALAIQAQQYVDAFSQIEAEEHVETSAGLVNYPDYAMNGYKNGNYSGYLVDFGQEGANKIIVRAYISGSRSLYVILDTADTSAGEVVGSVNVAGDWSEKKGALNRSVTGRHKVYLMGIGQGGSAPALDWFTFIAEFDTATNVFEAENNHGSQGTSNYPAGVINQLKNGNYFMFKNMYFGQTAPDQLSIHARAYAGNAIPDQPLSVYVDSIAATSKIVTFGVPQADYQTLGSSLTMPVTGFHDVYFVGEGDQNVLVDWFTFGDPNQVVSSVRNVNSGGREAVSILPTRTKVNLHLPAGRTFSYALYTMHGAVVKQAVLNDTHLSISTSGLRAGQYLLRLAGGNNTYSQSISVLR
ncbi:MAG: carbohydrate-binding protein [Chitinivibrionales bacterium]|nr:carbohydrate-binding protein [Chitinivibrionales bacterium]